jgi:tetratricopeptide (TPR) repeat protein
VSPHRREPESTQARQAGQRRLAEAERALARAIDGEADAGELADAVLAEPVRDEAAAVALRARALAAKEQGRLAECLRYLRRAVHVGERAGTPRRAAQARVSLVAALTDAGRIADALAEAERAAPVLTGVEAAHLMVHRGMTLIRAGHMADALEHLSRAIPALRRDQDPNWQARALIIRGTTYAYGGNHRASVADLREAQRLTIEAGLDGLRIYATQNLGFALLRAGDIPAALAEYDLAHRLGRVSSSGIFHADRAEALIAAGLAGEARELLTTAMREMTAEGFTADLAESHLLLAHACLLDGQPTEARQAADQAARTFARQRRHAFATMARHAAVSARWEAGERSGALLRDALRAAERLQETGWTTSAQLARLVAGRTALELGRGQVAEDLLTKVARARRRGPVNLRVAGWHAEALRRHSHGDRRGCAVALRAGLRLLEEYAATLGATDLRAHAAVHGEELARLGLTIAWHDRRPAAVLDWAERWRAGTLHQRPVRPPGDRELADDLAALRQVAGEIRDAGLAGRPTTALHAEQARLERAVRYRHRHARGRHQSAPPLRRAELLTALGLGLGERALVELVRLEDQLGAVTVVRGRVRQLSLGSYTETISEMESLRFSMNRLARRHGTARLREAARMAHQHARARLDALLLAPLREVIGDRELVVVPTGALHALPWPVLPGCAGRPVSVAPSARVWLTTRRPHRAPGQMTALVAGPGLEHAETEVDALAVRYPHAKRLAGDTATASAVAAAIDGADLAHIAAHGHFRSDNPLFSSLDLADGPLTVYDLERLGQAPRRMVLSACESALSGVRPGDELMGVASALFALGTRTLIASVTPVPDDASHVLMLDLHARLICGQPPAHALAAAQAATGVEGFLCFGAG